VLICSAVPILVWEHALNSEAVDYVYTSLMDTDTCCDRVITYFDVLGIDEYEQ